MAHLASSVGPVPLSSLIVPISLPILPDPPHGNSWCADVEDAHNQLVSAYSSARQALNLDESDPVRLRFHLDRASGFMVNIVETLALREVDPLPPSYIGPLSTAVGSLVVRLRHTLSGSWKQECSIVSQISAVSTLRTGRPGRPRKIIDREVLQEAFTPGRNISGAKLARTLGLDRGTVQNYCTTFGVQRPKFSNISDLELDDLVRDYKARHPNTGIRYLRGYMLQMKLRVQRSRLIESIDRVNSLGKQLRRDTTIKHREYHSARPNALWHLDGHHKLILWGIIIHGVTDGYDRTLLAIKPSTNNRPDTVLDVFLKGVEQYGCPSRLRGDRGGENMLVSIWMIMYRGPNRASFMWGSSTHNTRIERVWVEVGRHFARGWRAFFTRLGRLYMLDRKDPQHLWLLHTLFLKDIEDDCEQFRQTWNLHPISGKGENSGPMDLRFLGQLKNGVYDDPADKLDLQTLHDHYGVTERRPQRKEGETGAGHDDSEEEYEEESQVQIARVVGEGQERQIRHPAVEVPSTTNPFMSQIQEAAFFSALDILQEQGDIPDGFGLDDPYEPTEFYTTGRSRKGLRIPLPHAIWFPRTLLWCRAIMLLKRYSIVVNE